MAHMRKPGPNSVALSQLGARLRELREDAELTGVEAARRAKVDPGTISRVEHGLRGLTPATAQRLLDCYDVHDAATRAEVLDLVRVSTARSRRPSWWRKHRDVLSPTQFDGYLALESSACALRNYEPLLIPGLLQTPDYAHQVIAGMRPELSPAEVDELVEVRVARQRKITQRGTTQFSALIDETALLRPVGTPDVLRHQLQRLLDASEHRTTSIRLSPLTAPPHAGLAGGFVIMSFLEATRDIVWVETMRRSVYLEDDTDVRRYTDTFTHIWAQALTPEDTRTHLTQILKEQ